LSAARLIGFDIRNEIALDISHREEIGFSLAWHEESEMIFSLWSLIPWCGVAEDPAEAQHRGGRRRRSVPASRRGPASGEAPVGLAQRSIEDRVRPIITSTQTIADVDPLHMNRQRPAK
jgi:hypothetical protein